MTENDLMLTSIRNCRRVDLIANNKPLTDEQTMLFDQMKKRRASGEPLQYILGTTTFMDVELTVNKHVLIPRPETELLVEFVLNKTKTRNESLHICDLGTGSGNISIALTKYLKYCFVTSVDNSREAINVAWHNAKLNNVNSKINLVISDMEAFLKKRAEGKRKFDFLISNPPYIPTNLLKFLPEDVQHEPQKALDGGSDGLMYYRVISQYADQVVKKEGMIVLEIGDGQDESVKQIFNQNTDCRSVRFFKDYADINRIVFIEF